MEKRVMFQLCKRTHVYICTCHLPFSHLSDFVADTALVYPFFPFGVTFYRVFYILKAEFGVIQLFGIFHHLGYDFFSHFLVYFACFSSDEQLHLDGI